MDLDAFAAIVALGGGEGRHMGDADVEVGPRARGERGDLSHPDEGRPVELRHLVDIVHPDPKAPFIGRDQRRQRAAWEWPELLPARRNGERQRNEGRGVDANDLAEKGRALRRSRRRKSGRASEAPCSGMRWMSACSTRKAAAGAAAVRSNRPTANASDTAAATYAAPTSRTKCSLNGPVAATPGMKPYHERGAPIMATPFMRSASASSAAISAQRARGGLIVNIVGLA